MRSLVSNLVTCSLALNALSVMAQDDAISRATQRITDKIYARYEQTDGNAIKEMLVESGLSIEDSDRIARELLGGLVSCLLTAALSQAEEQSIPFADVLLAFEQALDTPEAPDPTIVDMSKVDERAESCALEEMQKAGITFEMMMRH